MAEQRRNTGAVLVLVISSLNTNVYHRLEKNNLGTNFVGMGSSFNPDPNIFFSFVFNTYEKTVSLNYIWVNTAST